MQINVFPNPATDFIAISTTNAVVLNSAEIFDITGKKVFSETLGSQNENKLLDVSALTPGIYVLHVSTNLGLTTETIVIQ